MAQNEHSKIKLKDKIANVINSSYAETIAMEADILINSSRTNNPDIENAHKIAFPNHDISFSEHVSSLDTIEQKMGVISGVKGKLFEIKVKDHLDNEFASQGLNVELAENVNQKGWDLVVKDQSNEPINYFQVKCSDNIDYITSSIEKYPEFIHIVPEDVYKSSNTLIDNQNIQAAPYTLEDLDNSVENAHNFVGSIGELFVPPVVTLGIIIISEFTQKPDINRAAKRISISGSAAGIGSVASIMTNTWWIGALMGLGVRHYLNKEWTPTYEDKNNSRKQIASALKHSAKEKELSKKLQLLEIYRDDMPDLKTKAAEHTVEMFFKAIKQPDYKYILKHFSRLSINRIGKERMISYLENIKHTFGEIILREGPIYKEYKKIKNDKNESVLIYLKYKTICQQGEFIETVLVIDKPWGIATYNISSGDIKSMS